MTRTETYKVLKFGKGSVVHGRDSRYWDKDDRRRDDDYNEDVVEHSRTGAKDDSEASVKVNNFEKKPVILGSHKVSDGKGIGLYNEAGRNELKMYEAEYEASLKNSRNSFKEDIGENKRSDDEHLDKQNDVVDSFDEYDDGIDYTDARGEEYDDSGREKGDHFDTAKSHYGDDKEFTSQLDGGIENENNAHKVETISAKSIEEDSSEHSRNLGEATKKSRDVSVSEGQSSKKSKRKGKRRKFSGKLLFS